MTPEERQRFALPIKFGGLGLPDPTQTADAAHRTSRQATQHLSNAIKGLVQLSLKEHTTGMRQARAGYKAAKLAANQQEHEQLIADLSEDQQRVLQRAVTHNTGSWISALPMARNGNLLCAREWRDGIAFRYGLEPQDLQPLCDGCGDRFDGDHALKCRKGGLIIRRHNDVTRELQRISEMNWPGTVLEPVIRNGDPSLPEGHPERDGLVGDLLVRGGVHTPQTDAILDVQVIYLNAPSRLRRTKGKRGRPKGAGCQRATQGCEDAAVDSEREGAGVDGGSEGTGEPGGEGDSGGAALQQPAKVVDRAAAALRTQEKGKELKHKSACEATRRDFAPFIVSTDGCLGEGAQAFLRRLGRRLAAKWQRAYSQVFGFIKARMSVAILRASSQFLRGPRTRVQGAVCMMEDGAALGVAKL